MSRSKCSVPRTLTEWKQNLTFNREWMSSHRYFGYVTDDNEICLARARQSLSRKNIMYYLGLDNCAESRKQVQKYGCQDMRLIQIGDTSISLQLQWKLPKKDDNHPNILMVNMTDRKRLVRLPVPITIDQSHYQSSNINDIDNNNNNNNRRNENINNGNNDNNAILYPKWIITDEMYQDAYILCLTGMQCAKDGNWGLFRSKVYSNHNIVELLSKNIKQIMSHVFLCLSVTYTVRLTVCASFFVCWFV